MKIKIFVISALVFVLAGAPSFLYAAGNATQPWICSRSCWGARSPQCTISWMSGLNRATIHHTAGASDYNTTSLEESAAKVRAIQNYHMDSQGWCDIGYHFLVDKLGNPFEGRYGSLTSYPYGAHDAVNTNSFGFSNMGYFHTPYYHEPTTAMKNAMWDVIAWRIPDPFTGYGGGYYGGYSNIGYICGHRDVGGTSCPGDNWYAYIGTNLWGGDTRDQVNSRIQGVTDWDASYVGDNLPGQMSLGQTSSYTITYKNEGSQTWNSLTRLATHPRGSSSVFYHSSWINIDRPTDLDQSSVGPGGNGSFTFTVTAPNTPGKYSQSFELVQEMVSWFEGTGDDHTWYVNVGDAWNAQYVSNALPDTMIAGKVYQVSITYKNWGYETWNDITKLATSNPRGSSSILHAHSWPANDRATILDQASVGPGENGTFSFDVIAPRTPGWYTQDFELVQEMVSWFEGTGDNYSWSFEVIAPEDAVYVEAECYDTNGEGISYHDTDSGNSGGNYRNDNVDIGLGEQGYVVGWIQSGEWLHFSDIPFSSSGYYFIKARISSDPNTNPTFHIDVDWSNVTGGVTNPTLGGWNNYATVDAGLVYISAGNHTVRFVMDSSYYNLDWIKFVPAGSNFIRIQTEDYDSGGEGIAYHDTSSGNTGGQYRSDDVDIETCSEGGYNVGWIDSGEWLRFSGLYGNGSSYMAKIRIASYSDGGSYHLDLNGHNWTGTKSFGSTGGWQNWHTDQAGIFTLDSNATMKLFMDASGWNTNFIDLVPMDAIRIQVEDYATGGEGVGYHDTTSGNSGGQYRSDNVDIELCSEGGYNVGWIDLGEWLKYTGIYGNGGQYFIALRVASPYGGSFFVEVNGQNVTGTVSFSATGSWQTWTNVYAGVGTLNTWNNDIKIVMESSSWNVDWIQFTPK